MKKIYTALILLLIIFAGLFAWWNNGMAAVNKNDKSQKIFIVYKGEGVREIANNLKKEGLIKDPVVFFILVKKLELDQKIQAGDFRLSPSLNAQDIAETLTKGILDIWVTIPEGNRAEEIADILEKKIPSFKPAWREMLDQNEGYLFPDTYLIPKDASIELIVGLMKNNFNQKFATIKNNTVYTNNQIVTIASLIERETKHAQDRPLVSSIIHNRLQLGMPLQIDATVQYALGFSTKEQKWWRRDIVNYLKTDSPYNTYVIVELPPRPIANPGLSSLEAAANPSSTDYLFYITDKSGVNRYARTNVEQNANIRKYGL